MMTLVVLTLAIGHAAADIDTQITRDCSAKGVELATSQMRKNMPTPDETQLYEKYQNYLHFTKLMKDEQRNLTSINKDNPEGLKPDEARLHREKRPIYRKMELKVLELMNEMTGHCVNLKNPVNQCRRDFQIENILKPITLKRLAFAYWNAELNECLDLKKRTQKRVRPSEAPTNGCKSGDAECVSPSTGDRAD